MSKFPELNNYISDVPMRFSDRYLSIHVKNNGLLAEEDDEDGADFLDRFQRKVDYNFNAELVAIEMFEMHQKKRKLEEAAKEAAAKAAAEAATAAAKQQQLSNSKASSSEKSANDNLSSSLSSNSSSSTTPNRQSRSSNFFQMIPGEILKPQPLNNGSLSSSATLASSTSSESQVVHSNCDTSNATPKTGATSASSSDKSKLSSASSNKLRLGHCLSEFENADSSPFDNVELQTIDDIQELNNVFQALHTTKTAAEATAESSATTSPENQQPENGLPSETVPNNVDHKSVAISLPSSSVAIPLPSNNNSNFYQPSSSNAIPNFHGPTNPFSGPYSSLQAQPSPYSSSPQAGIFNSFSNGPSNFNSMYANHVQGGYPPDYPNFSRLYPTKDVDVGPMTSERRIRFNANNAYAAPVREMVSYGSQQQQQFYQQLNQTPSLNFPASNAGSSTLRSTKSVSDLSNLSEGNCSSNNVGGGLANSTLTYADRSRTPPAHHHHQNHQQKVSPKPINLSDPYASLSASERAFVDNLSQMGFKRDRVSRAVKHIDIVDDKKIFEYLFALQQLEDGGYDCYESEIALHMNNYSKEKAETFLQSLKQICDLGFDREAAIKALFKSNNDRERAIDLLLNSPRA